MNFLFVSVSAGIGRHGELSRILTWMAALCLVKNEFNEDVRFGLGLFGIAVDSHRIFTRASEAFEMS